MKLLIEVPYLAEDPKAAFSAIDGFDCWDGFSIDESLLEAIEPWEDTIDLTKTEWTWLCPCLPGEISGRVMEMDAQTREKFMAHVTQLLRRASSPGLKWATVDLAVDRLAWPEKLADEVQTAEELAKVAGVLKSLRKLASEYLDGLCLSIRLPLPSIAGEAENMALELMRDCSNDQCKIFLNISLEELKTGDPESIFGPYMKYLAGFRIRYEPRLGIRIPEDVQESWVEYLQGKTFDGTVIFAPKVESLSRLETELTRLADEIGRLWHH
jgi:hypothetical protein